MNTNKRLYEQIKALFADKLSERELGELFHHREFEIKMRKQWDMDLKEEEFSDEVGGRVWKKVKMSCFDVRHSKNNGYISYWWSVAAVIVLLLGATWMYFANNTVYDKMRDTFVEVTTKTGRVYTLPDSTQVWMQPESSIRYAEDFIHNRKVWLKGNSHFDVHKRNGEHFIVYINEAFIEVKGTSFLINQEQADVSKVTLFSGKVDFTVESTGQTTEMKPSQELIFNVQDESVQVNELEGVIWKDGSYEFTNVDLQSWIAIVGRIYNVKISLGYGQPTKNLLNGRIRYNESLEEVIEKMCFSTGWRYKKEGNEYIIFYP